jgi:hypothetical protein
MIQAHTRRSAPRRILASCAAALAMAALWACAGPRHAPPAPEGPRRELTAAELQLLLAHGTIRPVTELEGDDPFPPCSRSCNR